MPEAHVMEGSLAVAHAVRACRPKVISAYPISPQTHIIEELVRFVANGKLDAKFLRMESEFSAASAAYGASATGVRSYTASSSQGLLLMSEVLYAMAGTRLPVVLTGVNRTVSAPVSIQPDHQDTMALRDCGVIQIHVEDCQEAYATHIQAFKVAEDPRVLLPVMVCMDGWVLTHAYEPIRLEDQALVDEFLPAFRSVQRLDVRDPLTYGAYADDEVAEFRLMMQVAMENAKTVIQDAAREYADLFGDFFGGLIQEYRCDGADTIILAMGSQIGTIKEAVDDMRRDGMSVGVVKVRAYRPFPHEAIAAAVAGCKRVLVFDKSLSVGHAGPLASDVKAGLYNKKAPPIVSCLLGMGGRDVSVTTVRRVVDYASGLRVEDIPLTLYADLKRGYLETSDTLVGIEEQPGS